MPIRYAFDEFELDPHDRRLFRAGGRVHLTTKPFNVLLHLIENHGRLVTRNELLDKFWGDSKVYDETLTKSVGAIRKALDDHSDDPRFIETHWAEGYRFFHPVERLADNGFTVPENHSGRIEDKKETLFIGPGTNSRNRQIALAIAGLGIVLLIFAGVWFVRSGPGPNAAGTTIRSIAVLPIKNQTGDTEKDFLCDGITEGLISSMASIEGLKVIARGSSFLYEEAGKDLDPIDAGKKLNVETILTGTLRRYGDKMKLSSQIISTRDGSVIWMSEGSEHPSQNILELQDQLTAKIIADLRTRLGDQKVSGARPVAANPAAHQLFLRGRYFWNKRNKDGIERAIAYFNEAVQIDPNYAQAFAGLADCYAILTYYADIPADQTFPKAKAAALKALELDDQMAEAHASMGLISVWYEHDWRLAEQEYRRSIETNPNYATGHHWYGNFLTLSGRFDEGINELRSAADLDPLSNVIATDVGMALFFAGRYDEALQQLDPVITANPNFTMAHFFRGWSLQQKGDHAGAITEFERAVDLAPDQAEILAMLSQAYAASGNKRKATEILNELQARGKNKPTTPFAKAIAFLGLDRRQEAIDALEECYRQRDTGLTQIKINPLFKSIRAEPRFISIVRRIGFES